MKKVVLALVVLLLIMPFFYYGQDAFIGYLARANFAKPMSKFFADKEKYLLLPNQDTLHVTLTAKDAYVWKAGWHCKQPCQKPYDWTTFDFPSNVLPNAESLRWLAGKTGATVTLDIPRNHLKNGKNYFAAYTCEGANKCNGNKWLLLPIEVIILTEVPDVLVSSVYVDLPEKNTGSFFVVVKNKGNVASPSGTLSYKVADLATEKTIAEGKLVMPSTLPGKTSVTKRVLFPLGDTIKAGISITLDPADKLIELDENNNNYYLVKELSPRYPEPPK